MIYAAIAIFALLLYRNLKTSKSFVYPPTLFSAVWLLSLAALAVAGDSFFPVGMETLLVYCTGGIAFSIGGRLVHGAITDEQGPAIDPARHSKVPVHRVLDLLLLLVAAGLPFLVAKFWSGINLADPHAIADVRAQMVEATFESVRSFQVLDNLVNLSIILALALHCENDGSWRRRWRAYAGTALALVASAVSGTKGTALMILMASAIIYFVRSGRVNFKTTVTVAILAVCAFSIGLVAVNFAYMSLPLSMESIGLVARAGMLYWLGGIVAFDAVVQDPDIIESSQHISRFITETANGFGAHFEIPSIHAAYTQVNDTEVANTYTLYFSYFKDFGWVGMILIMILLGALSVWLYNLARGKSPIGLAFYGMWSVGLVFSIHAEHFFLSLNFFIKMFVVLVFVYKVIPWIAGARRNQRTR